MAVKIRLSRQGKKNYAFYQVVVADSRAKRDGRRIEVLGTYNPNSNPAVIELNGERALYWLNQGAQPSDTCRRILSYEGVLLKKHLEGGITKGALTQEVADQKFNAWKAERDAKINSKKSGLSTAKEQAIREAREAEAKVNSARAEAIAKRKAEEALKAEEERAAKAAAEAEAAAQIAAETPAAEATEAPAENTEA